MDLAAGLAVGGSCLAAGIAQRNINPEPGASYRRSVLLAIYAEAIGLYGLIVALILHNSAH